MKRSLVELSGSNNTTNYAIFNQLPMSSRGIKCKYKIPFFSCACELMGNRQREIIPIAVPVTVANVSLVFFAG